MPQAYGVMMNRSTDEQIKKSLKKNHSCYVLITCDESSEEGVLEVNMSYECDPITAGFLLQSAQCYIDEHQIDCCEEIDYSSKVQSLNGS